MYMDRVVAWRRARSGPVAAVPQQGITRRPDASEDGCVSFLSFLSFSPPTCDCDHALVTLAVATKFFERMADSGVARTSPHCTAPDAHRLWTFHQLLADMNSDTADTCPMTGQSHQLIPSHYEHKYNATSPWPEKRRPIPKNCCLEF